MKFKNDSQRKAVMAQLNQGRGAGRNPIYNPHANKKNVRVMRNVEIKKESDILEKGATIEPVDSPTFIKGKEPKIDVYYKDGYVNKVVNLKGTKAPVEIYQGKKEGFSAQYKKSERELPDTDFNAEELATRLAKKGHKEVTFLD